MLKVNTEGLYGSIQAILPVFKSQNWKGRVIVVSPPIYSRFFRGKTAYAMTKVAMSVLTKGLAMDWEREGKKDMAITSIWPAVVSTICLIYVSMLKSFGRPSNQLQQGTSARETRTASKISVKQ